MAKAIEPDDGTSDKVGKLLPAEVTGLYLSVRALFTDTSTDRVSGSILLAMAALSLVASLIYIAFVRKVRNGWHFLIYSITFALWAVSLDSDRVAPLMSGLVPVDYFGRTAAALSLIWTFAISSVPAGAISSAAPGEAPAPPG